jgi:pentose-5-phosphate-3-epimerase
MIGFIKYLVVWISQNLAIPFWTIGHIHLMVTIYEDIIELLASCGMNIIVAIGFWISYLENKEK